MEKYLKLFFIALFASLSFSLTSCGDDDDDDVVSNSEIVGTWKAILSEGWEKENGKIVDSWKENGNDKDIVVFYANGKCELFDDEADTYNVSWSIKGDKLTVKGFEDGSYFNQTATIEQLSENTMILVYREKDIDAGITYELYETITYKRIK